MLNPRGTPEELARIGLDILERRIQPTLRAADHGRFVAIDVRTDDFEVDDEDYEAVMRLRGRRPDAEIWLGCVGERATYRIKRCP